MSCENGEVAARQGMTWAETLSSARVGTSAVGVGSVEGQSVSELPMILAPMVRASTLPLRLVALRCGATAAFSDEIIDRKLALCTRWPNEELGCVDYVRLKDGRPGEVAFRTCAEEREQCVLQLGTASAGFAVQAASLVAGDVAGVDVNMGCPKRFSTHSGSGAALLTDPDRAADIIGSLRRNLPAQLPVTAKIRLLPSKEDTVELMRRLEQMGAASITVHARYVDQRPREPAHWDRFGLLASCVQVPVWGNGDVMTREHGQRMLAACPALRGVMVARGALLNPTMFGPDPVSGAESLQTLADECIRWRQPYQHLKYCLLRYAVEPGQPFGLAVSGAKSLEAIRDVMKAQDWQPNDPAPELSHIDMQATA